ncbi:MAG: LysM peptidoglycan-binding domain-containing protein [Chloroflexota bacterium]
MKFILHGQKALFVLIVVVFVLLTTAVSTSAAPSTHDESTTHTVQYGEYLGGIAHHYGVTVQAILDANPHVHNPNLIYYGTVLVIPTGHTAVIAPPVQHCRYHHYVRYGESLSGIAYWYGVSPYAIAEANHIYNLNHIYSGQYLCVP